MAVSVHALVQEVGNRIDASQLFTAPGAKAVLRAHVIYMAGLLQAPSLELGPVRDFDKRDEVTRGVLLDYCHADLKLGKLSASAFTAELRKIFCDIESVLWQRAEHASEHVQRLIRQSLFITTVFNSANMCWWADPDPWLAWKMSTVKV